MDKMYEQYKDHDFSNAKPASEIPALQKLRQAYADSQMTSELKDVATSNHSFLDADIIDWMSRQDQDTKRHINAVIRHMMAMHS